MARTKAQAYPRIRRRKNPSGKVSWLVDLSKNVPRERLFFKTKEEAEIVAQQKRVECQNFGTSLSEMPDTAKAEAARLWKQLRDVGCTMTEAVTFFFKHAKPDAGERLVKDVSAEIQADWRKNGRSAAYLQVQKSMLNTFAKVHGEKPIHTVMSLEIEQWLDAQTDWKPRTRLNYLRSLSTLWQFAQRKKYANHNPLDSITDPTIESDPPGILTVKQAGALILAASNSNQGELLPSVAIGLFAGLRPAEIGRLTWEEIDLEAKLIEVTARKAKSKKRRFVTISDNLAAWLLKAKNRTGKVSPNGDLDDKVTPLAKTAGITPWPHDGMRHSFASYHLAEHKNQALTTLQLGHHNAEMLFAHYRELVKPAAAAEYWKLAP
jgi:integrase